MTRWLLISPIRDVFPKAVLLETYFISQIKYDRINSWKMANPIILSGGTCHVLQDEWPSQRFRPCIFFLYMPNSNWLFEVCVVIPYWLHYYSLLSLPRLGLVTTQFFFCFVWFGFLFGFLFHFVWLLDKEQIYFLI